ncbi:MAG: hypothetical protein A2445_00640 [Candidatus Jacksonbacteria bacterium RIFOXYC2_FULL_44_29]|nr:MAG: hypothetical protein UW45_C0010G0016 [Parcubacteria group bacterium GW2011_GWC2_44_22]OGY76063.1 MAG: hypothetical protein A2295_03855 [Candidatus Jacksonbacteria bacterium RIFOXYB2_FULL_44_15]OGY76366.1 MAG: hypothetical protein A2240_04370 [Candidatus Jacksonbacteria bacterium RIFOXYA2_FULL_43_12]OGY78004.1 MAG: hypothetical protein A2445_00640 [Candidatus Jacksonbacteria bacterium RIFOXYC2_FULL_44_29]OGY80324.1 MAG: hypothetical protein A2550_04445 [Candidatus Jacksonbacteria bacteri
MPTPQPADPTKLPPEKINKNILELAKAVEHVYGRTGVLIWRNFLAGMMHAFGSIFAYVVVIGLSVFIAQQMGLFSAMQKTWQNITTQINDLKRGLPGVSPESEYPGVWQNSPDAELPMPTAPR